MAADDTGTGTETRIDYQWTVCEIVITGWPAEGEPWSGYRASLRYDRATDRVTVLLNGQDLGMYLSMPLLKKQLAEWFANIEARRE